MTRRCMPARPGFPSSPAPGSSPPRCHLRPDSTAPAAAGKRTESPGDRKQSIIDFFKRASKQDRPMLDSPHKSSNKYGGSGLSITGTEQLERKFSSPKKAKPKRVPSEKSPILEAFAKGVREHRKDRDVPESRRPRVSLASKYLPKGTNIYAPSSYRLSKEMKVLKKKHRSTESRKSGLLRGNSREKDDRDRGKSSADSKKQARVSEAEVFKSSSRSLSSRSSLSRHHPGESPLGAKFQLSLASYCRERELKKLRREQMEQRIHSENSFSETSNLAVKSSDMGTKCQQSKEQSKQNDVPGKKNPSNLENGHLSRKRSSSDSWEPTSGSKQNKFPDKRKRSSVDSDMKSTRESIIPKAKEYFEKRPDGPHQKEKFIRHIALKTPGDVLRLEDIAKEPHDEADHFSANLAPASSGHHSKSSDQIRAASTKDIKMHKPHSPLPQEKSKVKKASSLQKNKTAGSMTSKETKPQPLLSHVPSAVSSRVPLDTKNCTVPVPRRDKERSSSKECSGHSAESSKHKEHKARTNKVDTNISSGTVSGESLHSECGAPAKSPPAALEAVPCVPSLPAPSDKAPADKESSGNSNTGSSALKRKLRGDFDDSDNESLGYNLDSDEEEETLKSLEEIMAMNFKQTTTTTGKPPALAKGLRSESSDYTEHVHSGTYTNTLERLVKEMEDTQRLDELQKQLQEDIRQGRGIKSPIRVGDQDSSDDEDGLLEEHREFLKKFSVTVDAIPDHHPGEEIFNFLNSGKIFSQYTLDLRDSGFIGQSAVEKLILKSGKTDQIFLTTQGFLTSAYHYVQCPVPVLKWLFRMMSVHKDCIVSVQILSTLMEITIRNDIFSDSPIWPWIPSLSDIAAVFFNMGIDFRSLFPLENLQPDFNEDSLISETQTASAEKDNEGSSCKPIFSTLPETNILNVVKFLGLCTSIHPEGYQDREIMLLIVMLFKMSLEKQLKQIPLVDFQSLLINLMKNIRDWNTKVPELCRGINELSSHPHNLLWMVQLVPNWTSRGRQLRQYLSLVIISKLLDEKPEDVPNASNLQISVLHRYLMQMKPSNLLKKMVLKKKAEQPNGTVDEGLHLELEKQAYYLTYILLHLVGEVSCSHSFSSGQRKHFVLLCGALEKHVKCDIREDARLFYRTKVKDLVARIHGKWQEIIQNCRPIQGQLHDFWVPDS
ncbi:SMC5-SMC6 complex localization factor protein 2 isoform X1 [Ochotona curzoniae]|uniref:SMC5-SMC6 complex localization factor protein 2 isoform X1 n=2 Tax=Ochotona curzoniae TaxID=130825 RepID=UPI001B34A8B1|nr:SMC5-SMC6 complex localization factor protein 2 isoform X1 [Ochotona curzoniae]